MTDLDLALAHRPNLRPILITYPMRAARVLNAFRYHNAWYFAFGDADDRYYYFGGKAEPWPSPAHYRLWRSLRYGFDYYTIAKSPKWGPIFNHPIFDEKIQNITTEFTPMRNDGAFSGFDMWRRSNMTKHWRWTSLWPHDDQGLFYDPILRWQRVPGYPTFQYLAQTLPQYGSVNLGEWMVEALYHHIDELCSDISPIYIIGISLAVLQVRGAGFFDVDPQ